jgi:hypothetical protein
MCNGPDGSLTSSLEEIGNLSGFAFLYFHDNCLRPSKVGQKNLLLNAACLSCAMFISC